MGRRGRDGRGGPITLVVKLIGAGVGLGVEAYHHRQEKKRSQSPNPSGEEGDIRAGSSRSVSDNDVNRGIQSMDINRRNDCDDNITKSRSVPEGQIPDEAPPEYVELPREEAEALIERGEAVPVDEKGRSPSPDEDVLPEYDEEDWALDEAADEADGVPSDRHQAEDNSKKVSARVNVDELIAKFMVKHPEIGRPVVSTGLPVPVILPQRRPGTKKRGFVRAYSPVLDNCGIDQNMFIDFLETFDECAKADPWIQGVMMAAGIAGFAPSVIAQAVSLAVQIAAGTASEIQVRNRANFYLNQMNEKLFKPRGLYALVMGFDPDATKPVSYGRIDLATQSIAKYDLQGNQQSKWKQFGMNLRQTSGTTQGEIEMPECAPLVFPSIDAAAGDKEKMSKMQRTGNWLNNYFDKQSQAKYNMENPDTTLGNAVPKPQFHSRISDPSHPARSGSPLALITGGKLGGTSPDGRRRGLIGSVVSGIANARSNTPESSSASAPAPYGTESYGGGKDNYGRRDEYYEDDDYRRHGRGRAHRMRSDESGSRRRNRGRGGLVGVVKKKLKAGVLYLAIVNYPTQEALQEARQTLQAQGVAQ
ncbi:MAG: hypothetical protein M1822_004935 [Bathelium mastoideum]|nr:MAG: hypothetical protein M1822_004935 [Bathelium mastoideum]